MQHGSASGCGEIAVPSEFDCDKVCHWQGAQILQFVAYGHRLISAGNCQHSSAQTLIVWCGVTKGAPPKSDDTSSETEGRGYMSQVLSGAVVYKQGRCARAAIAVVATGGPRSKHEMKSVLSQFPGQVLTGNTSSRPKCTVSIVLCLLVIHL